MNVCQAGHKSHNTKLVDTEIGKMQVYDYERYKDIAGYCTGKDDISRTLINEGRWEKDETAAAKKVLETGKRSEVVLDFGAHIGWFSILAAKMGYDVIAFEGDAENVQTLIQNAKLNKCDNKIWTHNQWIDGTGQLMTTTLGRDVALLKIDLEGNDIYAVRMCASLFERRKIRSAIIEISPAFNNSYPELVSSITKHGYTVVDLAYPDRPFDGNFDFGQSNFLFERSK